MHPPEKMPLFLAPLYPEPFRPRDGDGRIVERHEDVADRRRALVPHVDAGVDHGPELAEDSVNVSAHLLLFRGLPTGKCNCRSRGSVIVVSQLMTLQAPCVSWRGPIIRTAPV